MNAYHKKLARLLADETGATAIEYGVILLCIVVAIIVAVTQVGQESMELYESASAAFP